MLAYRFAADLETKEIAQVLGITKTAASSRLSRAVQAFKAAFEEAHPQPQAGGTR
jgi:DNA-directed RNA polymerase specialized sigma24 family protein